MSIKKYISVFSLKKKKSVNIMFGCGEKHWWMMISLFLHQFLQTFLHL